MNKEIELFFESAKKILNNCNDEHIYNLLRLIKPDSIETAKFILKHHYLPLYEDYKLNPHNTYYENVLKRFLTTFDYDSIIEIGETIYNVKVREDSIFGFEGFTVGGY